MDNNTRRYPRTSVEAFPKTVEYACTVERYERFRPLSLRRLMLILVLAISVSVLFAALFPTK
jgi:hypothetical protein